MEALLSWLGEATAIASAVVALSAIVRTLLLAMVDTERAVKAELATPALVEIHTGAQPTQAPA